jgi:cytochrome-b5 reductase
MIAGGTGITPMYQVIRASCEDAKDQAALSLAYSNQTGADILLREELDAFARKFICKFKVWHILGNVPEGCQYGKGLVAKEHIKERLLPPISWAKLQLCGSPGTIDAMKKNLAELGFMVPTGPSKPTNQVFLF